MALDTTIEARRNEINNISNEINVEKQNNEDVGKVLRENQIEALQKQILKQKEVFESKKLKTQGDMYADIATGKLSKVQK